MLRSSRLGSTIGGLRWSTCFCDLACRRHTPASIIQVHWLWLLSLTMLLEWLAGAGNTLLNRDKNHGDWQTRLYIIEGVITIVFGLACFFLIPSSFETACFFNEEDKVVMRWRAEVSEAYNGGTGHFTRKDLNLAFTDVKVYISGFCQFCSITILYGQSEPGVYRKNVLLTNHRKGSEPFSP